jgi:Carbamate kinase
MNDNQFARGSMLPKIESCIDFCQNSNSLGIITSLKCAKDAILMKTGTIISNNEKEEF